MHKKLGIVSILLGAALILSALLLFGYNRYADSRAGAAAEEAVLSIQKQIETSEEIDIDSLDPVMPVADIDGYDYVGYVSIPSIGIELPVMADWDYARLKLSPCRQFGSSRTDDLVIAAHNYETHFGRLSSLTVGDPVKFTDMDGIENDYVMAKTEVLDPAMVDQVENSGYALVLYTCTYGGKTRVTVFCDRAAAPFSTLTVQ